MTMTACVYTSFETAESALYLQRPAVWSDVTGRDWQSTQSKHKNTPMCVIFSALQVVWLHLSKAL